MSAPTPFDWLTAQVVQRASLSRAEARGMVRLVLRDNGLTAEALTSAQMKAVVSHAIGAALARVKVPDSVEICARIAAEAATTTFTEPKLPAADDIFERLGRR